MSGLGRVVVGYRPDERGAHYPEAVEVGKCVGCSCPVYLVKSGQDAYMGRDPVLVCSYCNAENHDAIIAEL